MTIKEMIQSFKDRYPFYYKFGGFESLFNIFYAYQREHNFVNAKELYDAEINDQQLKTVEQYLSQLTLEDFNKAKEDKENRKRQYAN